MDFLWTREVTPHSFPALEGDKRTDVLVIGGGGFALKIETPRMR
ncbi:MAG: hypothetical protein PUK69_01555 [Clostridiales bacterium]|nr:hypothetical protein [Clostridiales bacterium]